MVSAILSCWPALKLSSSEVRALTDSPLVKHEADAQEIVMVIALSD